MSIAIVELVSKGTADEQLCGKNNTKINEVRIYVAKITPGLTRYLCSKKRINMIFCKLAGRCKS